MRKHRIIWSTLLLLLALGSQASRCAQDKSTGAQEPDMEKRANMAGLVRTINTFEVTDFSQRGSYESWETLRERHRSADVHFGALPEILPGWNLRLNVNADGQGYVLLLEDTADKGGYALFTDERAVIRECKYLQ